MKSETELFELSTEELSLALSAIGEPENASALFRAVFGELDENERQGRYLAAGSSLAARSLLHIEDDETSPVLDQKLARLVRTLAKPEFTIKLDKAFDNKVVSLAYHVSQADSLIVKHTVRQAVLHRLEEVNRSNLIEEGISFFQIPRQTKTQIETAKIPQVKFDEIKARAQAQPTTATLLLERSGLSSKNAKFLVNALRDNLYMGNALKVEYDDAGNSFSNNGFLCLQDKRHTWMLCLSVIDEQLFISPQIASSELFTAELTSLLSN